MELRPTQLTFDEAKRIFTDSAAANCTELLHVFPERYWSPYPFAVPPSQYSLLRRIARAVRQAMHVVIENYCNDADIQTIMPLDPGVLSCLRRVKEERENPYKIGAWRPDFLFNEFGSPVLCEINARFAFNGYFVSHQGCSLLESLSYLKTCPGIPFRLMAEVEDRFVNAFYSRLANAGVAPVKGRPTLGILLGKEAGWDVHLFASRMKARGRMDVRFVKPTDLNINQETGALCDQHGVSLSLLALELHQDELCGLDPAVLLAVAKRAVLNDLWTIFVLHDKRLFAVMSNMVIMKKYISSEKTLRLLSDHIIPTFTLGQMKSAVLETPSKWLIKPHLLGKGKGFLIGSQYDGRQHAWEADVRAAPDEWIVQNIVKQRVFDVTVAEGERRKMYVVGVLLCLNDHLLAPGIFRASAVENIIVNVAGGNSCILLPMLLNTQWVQEQQNHDVENIDESFLSAFPESVWCNREDSVKVRSSLDAHGIAVIRDFMKSSRSGDARAPSLSKAASQDGQGCQDQTGTPTFAAEGVKAPSSSQHQDAASDEFSRHDHGDNKELVEYLSEYGAMNYHDAGQTLVWDVRPSGKSTARSHNAQEFPMHTDCCFEDPPPRFIALYVVIQDMKGGGISRFISTEFMAKYLLSPETLHILRMTEFSFKVPEEFLKVSGSSVCTGPIISAHGFWRYRGDIILRELLSPAQVRALKELDDVLMNPHLSLTTRLPQDALVILDNTRWFHGRSKIKDSARWLKRLRFHSLTPLADRFDFNRMESQLFFQRDDSDMSQPLSRMCTQENPMSTDLEMEPTPLSRFLALIPPPPCTSSGEPANAAELLLRYPILTKQDLFDQVDASIAQQQKESGNVDSVFEGLYWSPSGGTIGPPKYFPTSTSENALQRQIMSQFLQSLHVLDGHTICANLLSSSKMYRAMEILNDFVSYCGGSSLPIGALTPDEEVVQMIRTFHANTICGMPPRLVQLASHLKQCHIALPSVKRIIFGGEPLYEAKIVLIREAFGRDVEIQSIYGSAETGIWGVQPMGCHQRDCYAYCPSVVHVSILDPNEKGFGRIIVTNLLRTRFPVVRYDMGDIGRFETVNGMPGLRLAGRATTRNSFSLGSEYFTFTSDEIEAASSLLREATDYQIVLTVDDSSRMDVATFFVVWTAPESAKTTDDLKGAYEVELRADIVRVVGGTDMASVPCIVRVAVVSAGELKRTATGGKTIRVIDQRLR
jgi:phenylacetate-coenzyme A ligase PaaK-like adenylate-forming protein